MASPLIDYLRNPLGLGPKVIAASDSTKPADAPWVASNTPGVTIRTGKDGRMQTNGEALMVDKDAQSKAEPQREPPYLPPDFGGFEYHSANGKAAKYVRPAGEVAPKLDSSIAPIPAAPMTWQDGAPPCVGWREVNVVALSIKGGDEFAYWFGIGWSYFGPADQVEQEDIERGPVHSTDYIQWRGPRLTGARWPEPSAT